MFHDMPHDMVCQRSVNGQRHGLDRDEGAESLGWAWHDMGWMSVTDEMDGWSGGRDLKRVDGQDECDNWAS
jgi:hypothetical protein